MISPDELAQEMLLLRREIQQLRTLLGDNIGKLLSAPPVARVYPVAPPAQPGAEGYPECPKCGAPMVLRKSYRGPFYGCSTYPECRGSVSIAPVEESNTPF